MSGSEAFFEVRNEFYKDCSGAILVYDVTNKKSFDALTGWLEEARKVGERDRSARQRANAQNQQKPPWTPTNTTPHHTTLSLQFGASSDLPIILCANKVDKRRVVQEADGIQFAVANGLSHWDTSAQSGANVADVFDSLFTTVLQRPPYNG